MSSVINGSDGFNSGKINVSSALNNSIIVDSSGRVTMPYQPAFYAYSPSSNATTSTGPVTFNTTRTNIGNCYNTSNGIFTAPLSGTYLFFGKMLMRSNGNTSSSEITFYKNGANINNRGMAYNVNSSSNGHSTININVILTLNVGDYIQLGAAVIGSGTDFYLAEDLSSFSGRLIS